MAKFTPQEQAILAQVAAWKEANPILNPWAHWARFVRHESKKLQEKVKEILEQPNTTDAN